MANLVNGADMVGFLSKEGGGVKSWKKRLFVLYGDSLYCYEEVTGKAAKGFVVLRGSSKVRAVDGAFKGRQHCIAVDTDDRQLYVQCESAADRDVWLAKLQAVVKAGPGLRTSEEHAVIDNCWVDPVTTAVSELVSYALRSLKRTGLGVVELSQAYGLHRMTGEHLDMIQLLKDVDLDPDGRGVAQVQLKPLRAMHRKTAAPQSIKAASVAAAGKGDKAAGAAAAKDDKGGGAGLMGMLGRRSRVDDAGPAPGSSAAPGKDDKKAAEKEKAEKEKAEKTKHKVSVLAAVNTQGAQQVDVSVARSKPKQTGKRPPARKPRPAE